MEAQELVPPIFSPATKAESGHDENITFDQMKGVVGTKVAEFLRETSIDLYTVARDYARERGILIADTKFEFGIIGNRRGTPDRRGSHTRLVAILASG